jgi:hypothetical protein
MHRRSRLLRHILLLKMTGDLPKWDLKQHYRLDEGIKR